MSISNITTHTELNNYSRKSTTPSLDIEKISSNSSINNDDSSSENSKTTVLNNNYPPINENTLIKTQLKQVKKLKILVAQFIQSQDIKTIVNPFIPHPNIEHTIDFSTKKYIADGAFGEVSSAHLKNGSTVAIKEFKKNVYTEVYTNANSLPIYYVYNEVANYIKYNGHPNMIKLLGIYIPKR